MEIDTTNNNSNSKSNQIIQDENSPSSNVSEKKPQRKRRSKKDPNGRMFICQCGKGYLSKLALNNHTKSKHQNILFTPSHNKNFNRFPSQNIFYHNINEATSNSKKKRGRPKKSYDILCNDEVLYNTFFDSLKRKKNSSTAQTAPNIDNIIRDTFSLLFINNKTHFTNVISSPLEHSFLNRILTTKEITSKQSTCVFSCDDIFIKYLQFIYENANEDYFKFSLIFVILLRECINKYKNVELENTKEVLNDKVDSSKREFTEIYDGEQIPEICNEFLTEFLASANFFGMNSIEYKNEFQIIIQHFCFWLYENNFTSSKLIVNNKND